MKSTCHTGKKQYESEAEGRAEQIVKKLTVTGFYQCRFCHKFHGTTHEVGVKSKYRARLRMAIIRATNPTFDGTEEVATIVSEDEENCSVVFTHKIVSETTGAKYFKCRYNYRDDFLEMLDKKTEDQLSKKIPAKKKPQVDWAIA